MPSCHHELGPLIDPWLSWSKDRFSTVDDLPNQSVTFTVDVSLLWFTSATHKPVCATVYLCHSPNPLCISRLSITTRQRKWRFSVQCCRLTTRISISPHAFVHRTLTRVLYHSPVLLSYPLSSSLHTRARACACVRT